MNRIAMTKESIVKIWKPLIFLPALILVCIGICWSGLPSPKDIDSLRLSPNPPQNDFKANWIWVSEKAGYEWRNSYAYFRKKFVAAGELTLHIAADNWYELYIDGKFLDRGTAPADVSYKTFDTHRLTVSSGTHSIAVLVHHIGQVCATAMRSRPGLFVEIVDPKGVSIVSDASWKALPAASFQQYLPCMMSHFGFYEVVDCSKIPAGWQEPGFDDAGWESAEIIGPAGCEPWVRMIPRDIPLLETKMVPAQTAICRGVYKAGPIPESENDLTVAVEMAARVRRNGENKTMQLPLSLGKGSENEFAVIDFGREVTGHLRLEFEGAQAGQKVDIGYDETLDKNGLPNPRRTYVHFADRFFLRQKQSDLQVYGGRGFRYLLVDIAAGKGGLVLTGAKIDERTFPVEKRGSFRCSDPELDRLFEVGLTTTRLCMLDTFVDCPSRERVMWMDLAVEAPCASYGFGVTSLWRRALFLLAQNVSKLGAVAGAVKGFAPCDYDPMLISYTMEYVISVCDYYLHSGDRRACEALFPTLMKQFDVISRFTTPEGLVNEKWPGWGTFLDWSAMDFGGVSSCNNAIYIRMHRDTARLARMLGKVDVAKRLEEKTGRLAAAYRRAFWSPREKLFVDALYDGKASPVRSQLANVFAVWAGLVDEKNIAPLLNKIMDRRTLLPRTSGDFRLRPGFTPQTGGIVPIGTPGSGSLLVQVLFEHGRASEALAYIKENWIPISRSGTFAEHFMYDYNTSFCHGWGAGPVTLLPAQILGIRPTAPGFREIEISPQSGGLRWAEGTVPTQSGDIHVKWEIVDGRMHTTYKVPDGMQVVTFPEK